MLSFRGVFPIENRVIFHLVMLVFREGYFTSLKSGCDCDHETNGASSITTYQRWGRSSEAGRGRYTTPRALGIQVCPKGLYLQSYDQGIWTINQSILRIFRAKVCPTEWVQFDKVRFLPNSKLSIHVTYICLKESIAKLLRIVKQTYARRIVANRTKSSGSSKTLQNDARKNCG